MKHFAIPFLFTLLCLLLLPLVSNSTQADLRIKSNTLHFHEDRSSVSFTLLSTEDLSEPYKLVRQTVEASCVTGDVTVYLTSKYNGDSKRWDHTVGMKQYSIFAQSQALQDLITDTCRKMPGNVTPNYFSPNDA